MKETVFVVEVITEDGHQAVGGEGCPAHRKYREEDEDGGEGTGLEAHVDVHLERLLQAKQAQLTGLAQAHPVWVAVDANGVVPDGVQDPHERVQHNQEWNEEERQHEDQYIGMVTRISAETKNTLGGPGGGVQRRETNRKREGDDERKTPGDHDKTLCSLWAELVLFLDDDEETIYAYYKQNSHPLHHKQPEQHG